MIVLIRIVDFIGTYYKFAVSRGNVDDQKVDRRQIVTINIFFGELTSVFGHVLQNV